MANFTRAGFQRVGFQWFLGDTTAHASKGLGLSSVGWLICLTTLCVLPALNSHAATMIRGGKGNKPLEDPGWPKGAAELVNWNTRIAWWEDPPFGGGRWHAECKGDAEELSKVLQAFAALDVERKQVVVKEGIGYSFWLDPNQTKRADRTTKIDWAFTVWEAARWKRQRELPAGMSAVPASESSPPATLTVYSASVRWEEVDIPEGIEVTDNRLSAHGFSKSDGRVVEGHIVDASGKPIACELQVEHVQPRKEGGYNYELLNTVATSEDGHWVIKNFPAKWCRIVATTKGFASRRVAYLKYDRQPGWEHFRTVLAPEATLAGRVVDNAGTLLNANVRVTSATLAGERYDGDGHVTNNGGEFQIRNLPSGASVQIAAYLEGHVSVREEVTLPTTKECVLTLAPAGVLIVQVEFDAPPAGQYVVNVTPPGGEAVGKWGGSANVKEDGSFTFKNVPAGVYVLTGRPNPGSVNATTEPVEVTIVGGQETQVKLKAK